MEVVAMCADGGDGDGMKGREGEGRELGAGS